MTTRKSRDPQYAVYIFLIVLLAASGIYYALASGVDTFGTETRVLTSGDAYTQSSDQFDNMVSKYLPEIKPEGNHIRQQFEAKNNGLDSIEVRVKYGNSANVGALVFELKDDAGAIMHSYAVDASKIINWRYVTLSLGGFSIEKGNTYSLEIYMADGQASDQYDLFYSGMSIDENTNLYCNDVPIDGQLDIVYTYKQINYLMDWQVMASILAVLLFLVLDYKKLLLIKIKKIQTPIMIMIEAVCFTAIIAIVETLSQGNIMKMSFTAIVMNVLICGCLYAFILFITNNRSLSMILTAVLFFVLALINHYTLLCRGTVLLFSDIYSINTAAAVATNYSEQIKVDGEVLYSIRMLCVLTAGCICFFKGRNKAKRIANMIFFLISASVCYAVFTLIPVQEFLKIEVDEWNMTDRSHEIGFLLNEGECIQYCELKKPAGYDASQVSELIENTEPVKSEEAEKPVNIIVIMNESFGDLRNVGDFNTNEPFLKHFEEISKGDNCVSGKLVVPVYGGGTCCSEFEFLTGSSLLFMSATNAPYQQYIHDKTDSLASYLKNEGYNTLAMHPAEKTNWFRNSAYPKMGFDRFISIEDEEMMNLTECRCWPDDASFDALMIKKTEESDDDLFEFNVTMQNHGNYASTFDNFQNSIKAEEYEDASGEVSQYLTLISISDEAFGNLIDKVKASSEKTIVVMFGDHLPNMPEEFMVQYLKAGDDYLSNIKVYETPYIIWANYDIEMPDIPEVLSVNFFAPYILQAAGEELTGYYAYLYDLSQQYPIVSSRGIYDCNMLQYTYTEDSPCYEAIHEYEMVQYARLR